VVNAASQVWNAPIANAFSADQPFDDAKPSVTMIDRQGATCDCAIRSASKAEVEFVVLADATPGPASIRVQNADGSASVGKAGKIENNATGPTFTVGKAIPRRPAEKCCRLAAFAAS
jgi:hypothetical protein